MKNDLAIFGAAPAFSEPLHVGRPNIGNRSKLMARIEGALDRGWLTNSGPLVEELEQRIAEYLGVRHCIATCNATLALAIAIKALGLQGQVIVPSFTFVAVAHVLHWHGLTPVFCDIDSATHNIDPGKIEALVTPDTSALLPVHLWGRGCAVQQLTEIAARFRLALLFDASHAFGCTINAQRIGGFGDAEVFSFHATKFINSLEGGVITTNDGILARRARLMRNFGFAGYDRVLSMGINGKMNEISAAMGHTSLDSLDEFITANRRNFLAYQKGLRHLPGIEPIAYDQDENYNYQYIVVEVDSRKSGLSRDMLLRVLHAENVLARRYFYPGNHRMSPYDALFPDAGARLLHTERLCERILCLPTGIGVGEREIEIVCGLVAKAIYASDRIH